MKIATRLKLAALVPALMAVVITVSLVVSYRVVWEAQEKDRAAQRVITGMNELSGFISEYVLYHEKRPLEQFLIEHDLILETISAIRTNDSAQQQVLERIRRDTESMRGSFLKLALNNERYGSRVDPALIKEVENRLAGRLLVWSRDVVSESALLEKLIDEDLTRTERRINTLIFFLILAATLFLTMGSVVMTRSITTSLSTLRRGTEKIGGGDFGHRIALPARDEIGELSQSFDQMTEQLQKVTVSRDVLQKEIEERRKVEAVLREHREWLRVTLNSIGDAVLTTDAKGHVSFLNPVASNLTGWPSEEAQGRHIQDVLKTLDELSREPAEDVVARVLKEGRVVNMANHTVLVRRDGSEVPIEDSAAPIQDDAGRLLGVVIVFHDVTEKRRAQKALRESAEKLRIVADFTYGWEYWRSPDGRFLYVSPSCERVSGYPREAFMEDPELYTRIIHPEDRGRISMHMEKDKSSKEPHKFEFRILPRNGGERWIAHVCQPVLDGNGQVLGRRASNRDITERKRVEEELLRSHEELENRVQDRTAKLEERARQLARLSSQLTVAEQRERRRLSTIIHDHLQQLLVGAKIRLEVLGKEMDEAHRGDLDSIYQLLVEALKTGRSLNTQLSPNILYERGLASGLESLAESMNRIYPIEIQTEMDPNIMGEREESNVLLFESVRELLFNVVKHAQVSSARLSMRREGTDHLKIIVEDQGVGFDPASLSRESGSGDRFGLFSIRERLELLGGGMEIDSAPGRGATFTLYVPVEAVTKTSPSDAGGIDLSPAETVTRTWPSREKGEKVRIMLVDDHVVMRQGLSSMLSGHADLEVVGEATDGEEAVRLARDLRPEVILMDIKMPRMSGIEATRRILSESPNIRIIGLSMYDDAKTAKEMLKAGAVAFMIKSSHSNALLNAIRSHAGYSTPC